MTETFFSKYRAGKFQVRTTCLHVPGGRSEWAPAELRWRVRVSRRGNLWALFRWQPAVEIQAPIRYEPRWGFDVSDVAVLERITADALAQAAKKEKL